MEENHAVRRFRLLAEGKPDIGREPPKDSAAIDQLEDLIRSFSKDEDVDDLMDALRKKTRQT